MCLRVCTNGCAHVWRCVCREISKYYGRFSCMFMSWISVYVWVCVWLHVSLCTCVPDIGGKSSAPQKFKKMHHVLNLHLLVSMKTCTTQYTLLRTTHIHTVPQVSVCVIWRGITLWQDHTGDSFQLSKHHIKHTHALTHTYTYSTGYSLLASLLRNWEKLLSIKTCWHHLDG